MKVFLRKNQERRLLKGHQWIFSNEIERVEDYSEEQYIAELFDVKGKFIGKGFYNRNSLIAFRLLTTLKSETVDREFFSRRIVNAFNFRNRYSRNISAFRVVYGESDFLPGLVIDKYNNYYSVQIYSKGVEHYSDVITDILVSDIGAEAVVLKNDFPYRRLEGLELYERIAYPSQTIQMETIVELDGIKYHIDLLKGQKTGHYLDQVDNRLKIRQFLTPDSNVLDLFCNDGGFALNAARAGVNSVIAVDISENALSQAKRNAELNNLQNKISFTNADVFDFLKVEVKNRNKYDVVILDPPSLTKSRKDLQNAINAYIRLNSKALKLINTGGFLFTFSCSGLISESLFRDVLARAAGVAKRQVRVIYYSICSFDHCFLPAMEETVYLKSYLLNVI